MNRYQHEVARFDRRRHLLLRTLTFLGVAGLVLAALWAASPPIQKWWDALGSRALADANRASGERDPVVTTQVEPAGLPIAGATETSGVAGTESSIASTRNICS